MSHLLSEFGRPLVELGGTRAWRQYVKGDIVVSLQWLDVGGEDGAEPCMALFPAHRRMDTGAYVITQGRAHEFALPNGAPTPALLRAGFMAAAQLGFHPDKSTVHRFIDAIVESIADLIRMPSQSPHAADDAAAARKTVAGIEAVAKVNGKTFAEALF